MVVAVQSNHPAWASHMLCDGEARVWSLRRPLRALLAASATLLGGLLPPHLAPPHGPLRGRVARHNWLWSVGASPLAHTSAGLELSGQFATLVHRHYVVHALNASVGAVGEAVRVLSHVRATREIYDRLTAGAGGGDDDGGGGPPSLSRVRTAHSKVR